MRIYTINHLSSAMDRPEDCILWKDANGSDTDYEMGTVLRVTMNKRVV